MPVSHNRKYDLSIKFSLHWPFHLLIKDFIQQTTRKCKKLGVPKKPKKRYIQKMELSKWLIAVNKTSKQLRKFLFSQFSIMRTCDLVKTPEIIECFWSNKRTQLSKSVVLVVIFTFEIHCRSQFWWLTGGLFYY